MKRNNFYFSDFNIKTLDVGGTYAKVSWKVCPSSCDKLSSKANVKISLEVDNTVILTEKVPYGNATKTLRNLRPGIKYEVIITERLPMRRIDSKFRHTFETREIGKLNSNIT